MPLVTSWWGMIPAPHGFCYPDAQIKTIITQDLAAINGPFSMPPSCPARSLNGVEGKGLSECIAQAGPAAPRGTPCVPVG